MSIEIGTETVISLSDAAKRLPHRRDGKPAHIATLYRWARHGFRGVTLETIQVGGTLCTSVEALQRFCDQLTGGQSQRNQIQMRSRKLATDDALRRLAKEGI